MFILIYLYKWEAAYSLTKKEMRTIIFAALAGKDFSSLPQHPKLIQQPGEQTYPNQWWSLDRGRTRLREFWGGGRYEPCRGQREGRGHLQLFFLPLHAFPRLSLHHDDPYQLVQVCTVVGIPLANSCAWVIEKFCYNETSFFRTVVADVPIDTWERQLCTLSLIPVITISIFSWYRMKLCKPQWMPSLGLW